MTQLIAETNIKAARKEHYCRICGGVAARVGEPYKRSTYVYDGRVYDWIECAPCSALNGEVWDWCSWPEEGIGVDQYDEWALDHKDHPTLGEQAQAYRARRGIR
jgi:hypothetical protein